MFTPEQKLTVANTLASYTSFFGYQSLISEAMYTTAMSTLVKDTDENDPLSAKHANSQSPGAKTITASSPSD